jgi:uncharacterized protein (UPF0333 family)
MVEYSKNSEGNRTMKFKILILITIIAVSLVGYYAYNSAKQSPEIQNPISSDSKTSAKSGEKTALSSEALDSKEFQDPSGFKFSYPADLKVSVISKNDPDYYSSLKLESAAAEENLTIDITATEYKSLDEWIKNNKQIANNATTLKLGGINANKIQSKGKIMIIAVDLDTLITLTSNFSEINRNYWENATEKVATTFAFELPEADSAVQSSNPAESSGDDIEFEGEEVIE